MINRRALLAASAALPLIAIRVNADEAPQLSMSDLVRDYDLATAEFLHWIDITEDLSDQIPPARIDVALPHNRERGETRFVYTLNQLRREANQRYQSHGIVPLDVLEAKRTAWLAKNAIALRNAQRRHNRAVKRVGLDVVRECYNRSDDQLDRAAVALMLRKPRNEAEAKEKRECLARHSMDANGMGSDCAISKGVFDFLCSIDE